MTVKTTYEPNGEGDDDACLLNAPIPCIAHWNLNHFVVIYKTSRKYIWIADPGAGKFKLKRADFEKS